MSNNLATQIIRGPGREIAVYRAGLVSVLNVLGGVNMKKANYLDLITSIDVLNTINGGVSEPQMNLVHFEET